MIFSFFISNLSFQQNSTIEEKAAWERERETHIHTPTLTHILYRHLHLQIDGLGARHNGYWPLFYDTRYGMEKGAFAQQMAFQYDGIILDMFVQLYEIFGLGLERMVKLQ